MLIVTVLDMLKVSMSKTMTVNESQKRLEKAFVLVDNDKVIDITDTHATVLSNGNKYRVNHRTNNCRCVDNQIRKIKCKHIYAVLIVTNKMKTVKVI